MAHREIPIKLSTFILDEMDQILACWDEYASTMTPAADEMSRAALRDHSEAMLRTVALDIDSPQTEGEQIDKSHGESMDDSTESAASEHGHLRRIGPVATPAHAGQKAPGLLAFQGDG